MALPICFVWHWRSYPPDTKPGSSLDPLPEASLDDVGFPSPEFIAAVEAEAKLIGVEVPKPVVVALASQQTGGVESLLSQEVATGRKEWEASKTVVELPAREQKYEQQLKDAMDAGDFVLTSALGQKFQRAFAKGTPHHEHFKAQKTLEAKKNYRIKWASEQYNELQKRKVHETAYEQVNTELGEYLPWKVIADREGGDRSAQLAAYNYVRKCSAMQGKWVAYNAMTERYEYLYIRRQHSEVHREVWLGGHRGVSSKSFSGRSMVGRGLAAEECPRVRGKGRSNFRCKMDAQGSDSARTRPWFARFGPRFGNK